MSKSSIRFISYPRTEPPPSFVPTIVDAFRSAEVQIGSEALAQGLTSDAVLTVLQPQLESLGFQVEKGKVRDQKIERPVFFGEYGIPTLRYQIELMFDASHSLCANGHRTSGNPARRSGWEIHPVYAIDVCHNATTLATCRIDDESRWRPLDRFLDPGGEGD